MRFFTTIQQVTLATSIVEKAWSFAKEVTPTTDYSDTRQTNPVKVRLDHFKSKLGEEAVCKVLLRYGEVIGPDYNIYLPKQKSWDDDLYFENNGIAVKTMFRFSANRYGLSWVFQNSNSRCDIISDKPHAWVFFVECNDIKNNEDPYELYVYPPYQVKELIFGEPRRKDLRSHKRVVYGNSLPAL